MKKVFDGRLWGTVLALVWLGCGGSNTPPWEESTGSGPVASSSSSGGGGSGTSSGGPSSGGGGDDDASSDDGPSGVVTGGFAVSGQVDDWTTGTVLTGASMCAMGAPSTCAPSSMGAFIVNGVAPSNSGITGSLSGYASGVWPMTPDGDVNMWDVNLRSTDKLTTLAGSVGATYSSATGVIYFYVGDGSSNPLSGASVSVPVTATISYYSGDGSGLSTTLGSTTSNGGGYIFGVPTGNLPVTFAAASLTCTRSGVSGWPPVGSETMVVPVMAGSVTLARAVCQ